VLGSGASRRRIARTLQAAYDHGLLSQDTFTYRFDQLLAGRLIFPGRLIGDLRFRRAGSWRGRVVGALAGLSRTIVPSDELTAPPQETLLALDWSGSTAELLVGRHYGCDIMLEDPTVSRRHAQLVFRDDSWIVHDLDSTNGTMVNGARVGRCAVQPGDRLALGEALLVID
jgi:FHA domain